METTTLRLGNGSVTIDAALGAPIQFTAPDAPNRTFLLDATIPWHSVEHAWGTGYVISDTFAGRWSTPASIKTTPDSVMTQYRVGDHLAVEIERHGGDVLRETYRFRNTGDQPMRITSLGIQTPFADLYPGALDALSRRVHAHIFTGGAWSWVAAQPMDGTGRILGLTVREGALWGYSVETRNTTTISNARGHLVLHVTDNARNPNAFGGQPVIELAPGADYLLSWDLAWYENMSALEAGTRAPAQFSSFSATVGDVITVHTDRTVRAEHGVEVRPTQEGASLTSRKAGNYWVQIGDDARTEVLFHEGVEATVRKRSAYVLDHQLSNERPGLLTHAIVPVDTTTGLTQTTNGWSDWSDGSERIGVAIMLQQALLRGWLDASVDVELDGWAAFARTHLIDADAAPRRGSQAQHSGIRLYDSPWLARFFLLRHEQHLRREDLDLAARLLERGFELGIGRFLTIGFSEIVVDVAAALTASGDQTRAADLREALLDSARHFTEIGTNLPGHEVAYEQSMVAPLLNLLIDAHRLSDDPIFIEAIRARLPWLAAFGGPQPHARLHGVAVRHWDGYWFGQRRQWGDVFPHYWSALTATVLLRLPEPLRTDQTQALGYAILRANMANYFADGSATCAFVMPTSVDGVPAHSADPLANDQDFHLALWLQLEADGYASLA
ncbi:hypothetical protein ASF40_19525 [Microbacterium sp. Leaf288]|nr:hypothetical protein ASF40_19525 [Microbacterium sp. Leaf288]